MSAKKQVIIVGGGIVGLATAYRLQQRSPEWQVTILEKEHAVGQHQSTHNSGVLHAGLYYKPGSQKARLAVTGLRQMVAFCREHEIAHEICGKLVVATRAEELPRLRGLLERGQANGLQGLRLLERPEMLGIEPHVDGLAAIHVPEEGIVDYAAVVAALARKIQQAGGTIHVRANVRRLIKKDAQWLLQTPDAEFIADVFVNCAGLHSDRVCQRAGERANLRIIPFRGEYYRLKPARAGLVRNLIYPVPDPQFPFLGVHFTRLIHGGIEAGPNAVLAFAREGYRFWDCQPLDLLEALAFPGLWRFLWQHRRMCAAEFAQSFSREKFCRNLQRLVPDIRKDDLETGGAGVRAQAMLPSGRFVEDFHFVRAEQSLHVLNAPSPAATASLAIAEQIVEELIG